MLTLYKGEGSLFHVKGDLIKGENSLSLPFIIDTGATNAALPYCIAKKLGFTKNNDGPINRIANGKCYKSAGVMVIDCLVISKFLARNVMFSVDPPEWEFAGHGLLGMNFLSLFESVEIIKGKRMILQLNKKQWWRPRWFGTTEVRSNS